MTREYLLLLGEIGGGGGGGGGRHHNHGRTLVKGIVSLTHPTYSLIVMPVLAP